MDESKPRCQGILLTPSNRYWAKYHDQDIRCNFNCKPESNFCGVHAKLGLVISEIIWKEN